MKTVLTGITTTGTPHLGNYIGAIKPAFEASQGNNIRSFYFLADYHALIKRHDPKLIYQSTMEISATWLAFGLDPKKVCLYRQSDIPELAELTWYLSCITGKGLMNRAHAYKAAVKTNKNNHQDQDYGITMGLFSYPVLMTADILLFKANDVPVGRDQIQHVEMAREIAKRFNYLFGEYFEVPRAIVQKNTTILPGLDGKKMSKSYNNTIQLFGSAQQLKKKIYQIKTNLLEPGESKDPDTSTIFQIWKAFASPDQTEWMRRELENGISWGEAKKQLFGLINNELHVPRKRYNDLIKNPDYIERMLLDGAHKARIHSKALIDKLREAIGIQPLGRSGAHVMESNHFLESN